MKMTAATLLVPGDHVDLQPVYEAFGTTDTGDYLASQSEYAVVASVEVTQPVGDKDAVLVHFTDFPSFKLAADYLLPVDPDIRPIEGAK